VMVGVGVMGLRISQVMDRSGLTTAMVCIGLSVEVLRVTFFHVFFLDFAST